MLPRQLSNLGAQPMFVTGRDFLNTSSLSCRVGSSSVDATFISDQLILCFVSATNVGIGAATGERPDMYIASNLDKSHQAGNDHDLKSEVAYSRWDLQ